MTAEAIVQWLSSPDVYADRPANVKVVETHISWVFLTGKFAYKLKKPVRFDFLDFRTLESRQRACEDEVRLNSRLAPDVYIGIVPIYVDEFGRFSWEQSPDQVDCLVKMIELPGDKTLEASIQFKVVDADQVDRLSSALTSFYKVVERPALDPSSYRLNLKGHIQANRQQLLTRSESDAVDLIKKVHTAQLAMLALEPEIFDARVADGRVVDGHGDLRPDHIYLVESPLIIDCIEFNAEFRRLDVADELSFLCAECDRLGVGWIGDRVLDTCCRQLNDTPPPHLVSFYKAYRACVRAKVLTLRAKQMTGREAEEALRIADIYIDLARTYTNPLPGAMLIVVGGLMGTGKSTLAKAVGESLGMDVLSTDEMRRELFGPSSNPAGYQAGNYGVERRGQVYKELCSRAATMLRGGVSVVLDGTFLSSESHELARDLTALSQNSVFVRCTCPDDVARQRIARRQASGPSLSEARPELYDLQKQEAQLTAEADWVRVDTTAELDDQVQRVLQALKHSGIPSAA